jgi:hypothetical protein
MGSSATATARWTSRSRSARSRWRAGNGAHRTLSETTGLAAEAFEGTITDLYLPKKK